MKIISTCIFMSIAATAFAADYPTSGLLYNQKEDSALRYSCSMRGENLHCEFVQSSVQKKAKPADLEKKRAEARAQFPNASKAFTNPQECDMIAGWLSVASGKEDVDTLLKRFPGAFSDPAKLREGADRLRKQAGEHPDELDMFKAMASMCEQPTEANYLKLAEIVHSREVRTCIFTSNPYGQDFVWVADYGNSGAWVVDGHPDGPCGVVELSRFEKDPTAKSNLFWRYTARKTATNPSGTTLLGLSCSSAVDQDEYVYDWRKSRDERLGCEFVEFSPF